MDELVDLLRAQYSRIENLEHGRYTVRHPLKAPCPVCDGHPDGFESGRIGAGETRLEPCGHEIPNDQFVELYAENNPDPFVLEGIESKRRIVDLCASETQDTGGLPLAQRILRLMAQPYADHEDFRPE